MPKSNPLTLAELTAYMARSVRRLRAAGVGGNLPPFD